MLISSRVLFQVVQNVRLGVKTWPKFQIMSFYAVARGRTTGIFMNWADCEAQVKGYSGAKYKKFDSVVSAQDFISAGTGSGAGSGKTDAPKTKHNSNYSKISKPKLKRTYTTTSSINQRSGNSSSSKTSNSSSKPEANTDDDSSQSDEFDDGLDAVLNKQMDDIEKRLKAFQKGVDKIIKKETRGSGIIMIEPPRTKRPKKSANDEYEEDNEGYVQVYTDGACSSNGRKGARAGIGVYWGEEHPLNVSEPVSGRATNNCGEIQAATRAIQQAIQSGIKKLTINTDSQFLINSVVKWMPGWKKKGWKLASGEPVKNEKDFKELDRIKDKLDIKWKYVEAHQGIHGNEMADQLAKAGAALYNC